MRRDIVPQRFRILLGTPQEGEDHARLQLEELNSSALSIRPLHAPLFAVLLVPIALRWANWHPVLLWFLFTALYPQLQRIWRQRLSVRLKRPKPPRFSHIQSLLIEVPMNLAWMLYVPLCWIPGHASNNAFLLLYIMGCTVMSARVYGPSLHHLLGAIAVNVPFVALYTIDSGDPLTDGMLVLLQVSFFVLLAIMAFHYHRTFRQATLRLVAIENQMKTLAIARDEAERASTSKSAFLASMSHELRTPLNAIIGFSDMIRQGVYGKVQPTKYNEYAEDIYNSGQHLLALINDVLDLSKIEAGKRELVDNEIDIRDLLEQVTLLMRPLALKAAVVIRIDAPEGLILTADERALRQIFFNMLSNAVKFSPPGGIITAFARPESTGSWQFGVSDQGVGMDKAGLRKALEPYGQINDTSETMPRGTGLGLPIVKALIEAHGAVFHIESQRGEGTTVWGSFDKNRTKVVPRR